jgi:hypothetical protein
MKHPLWFSRMVPNRPMEWVKVYMFLVCGRSGIACMNLQVQWRLRSKQFKVRLMWIPAQVRIPRNEMADGIVKDGAKRLVCLLNLFSCAAPRFSCRNHFRFSGRISFGEPSSQIRAIGSPFFWSTPTSHCRRAGLGGSRSCEW